MLNRALPPQTPSPVITMPANIVTPRAMLRKVRLSDAAAVSAQVSDYDIAKMTQSIPFPMPKVSAEIWLLLSRSAWDRGLRYSYAVCPVGSDKLRGVVSLFQTPGGEWEIGYWIARDLWSQGYAAHCARAAMDAFEAANGPARFHAGVFDDNPASAVVLAKLGFKPTGMTDNLFSMARLENVPGKHFIREPGDDR